MPDIERLHELHPPTLLLTGLYDVDELRLMADFLAASSDEIEGGHLLQVENPGICAKHIAVFHDFSFPLLESNALRWYSDENSLLTHCRQQHWRL